MSDIAFVKGDKEKNFTVLDNTCIRDETLSWGAKGLHCYLEHLPGDWKIYKSYLISHFPEKRVALNNLIKELVDAGYIEVEKNLRNPNGTFAPQRYIVFEKPNNVQCRLSTADNTTADNRLTEKQHLLTTNKLNTNLQRIELTNLDCKSETVQTVSESVNIINSLFGGEYPFDKNFKVDVLKHLTDACIEETHLKAYLKYVFERTKLANPIKSFEGLYRKLALSNSILRDFKLSASFKQKENVDCANPHERKFECPICHTVFDEYDYYCPKCSLTVEAIKNNNEQEIIIKSKLYHMAAVERSKLDEKYKVLIAKKGRGFLTADEQIQFYKDNGILN